MDFKANSEKAKLATSEHNLLFWFHVVITFLAWAGPFLFSWYLMVTAYAIVMIQFMIFGRCLLNGKHGLDDNNDTTFYSYLFEQLGIHVNRSTLKVWVRKYVYIILGIVAVVWQLVLGFEPLLFF